MSTPTLLVIGAGPGIGASLARRCAREGYAVALIGIAGARLDELGSGLQAEGITTDWTGADLTDADDLSAAVRRLATETGRIDLLHFNPSAYRGKDPLSLTAAELLEDVAVGVGALLTAVQAAEPYLRAGSRIVATGSMAADKPSVSAASLGVQKAGLRNLVRSLDATLAPREVRAVSVTVQGALAYDDPTSRFHPDQVAEALYAAATQPLDRWQPHLTHPADTPAD